MTVYLLQSQSDKSLDWCFIDWRLAVWTDLNALHAFLANQLDVAYPDLCLLGDKPRVWLTRDPRTHIAYRIVEVETKP